MGRLGDKFRCHTSMQYCFSKGSLFARTKVGKGICPTTKKDTWRKGRNPEERIMSHDYIDSIRMSYIAEPSQVTALSPNICVRNANKNHKNVNSIASICNLY